MDDSFALYTIGHSNRETQAFIALLRKFVITTLVDVRSQPYSQWAHQFNREVLKRDLADAGIGYVYMGATLGGRPTDPDVYAAGHVRPHYKLMAKNLAYQATLRKMVTLAEDQTVTVMCSEDDHAGCHRHLLITQSLLDMGLTVGHIQTDGTCIAGAYEPEQLSLFG